MLSSIVINAEELLRDRDLNIPYPSDWGKIETHLDAYAVFESIRQAAAPHRDAVREAQIAHTGTGRPSYSICTGRTVGRRYTTLLYLVDADTLSIQISGSEVTVISDRWGTRSGRWTTVYEIRENEIACWRNRVGSPDTIWTRFKNNAMRDVWEVTYSERPRSPTYASRDHLPCTGRQLVKELAVLAGGKEEHSDDLLTNLFILALYDWVPKTDLSTADLNTLRSNQAFLYGYVRRIGKATQEEITFVLSLLDPLSAEFCSSLTSGLRCRIQREPSITQWSFPIEY